MTQTSVQQPAATRAAFSDTYLMVLGALLMGYALLGKTVAYIGVPPLYIGEVVFALGIVTFLASRCVVASFAALPNLLLAFLIVWGVARTVPYLREDGFDALRDAMLVFYGGFAFVVTALLLEKPERLQLTVKFLRVLALVLIPLAPFIEIMTNAAAHADGDVVQWSLAHAKIGTTAVHLSAAALLVVLGFMRPNLFWVAFLIVAMGVAASLNRGAMLVIVFMLSCGSILGGKLREFAVVVGIGAGVLGLAYVTDLSIPTARETRSISAEQLVENVASVFGARDNQDLSGTKEWRLHWWDTIVDYTINGPHFWTGKGFGVDLGADDNVIHISPTNPVYPTRSPHSAHLTILARAGVPGFTLWVLTLVVWGAVMLANMVRARLRGDDAWAGFFLLAFCYACGFLIDASVDVTLEGPMAGIWFWCVFGAGSAASLIYRSELVGGRPLDSPLNRAASAAEPAR
jgi:hypothetical protein